MINQDSIIEAGHDEDHALHVWALCQHLSCEPDDVSEAKYNTYGLPTFEAEGKEFAIGTDDEANAAVRAYVEDSIWAFNADFILSECGLPDELAPAIRGFQEAECEGANDALLALVEKCSDLDSFTQAAIRADGRGHFLNGYDGEEYDETVEGETFYIYRVN